MMLKELAVRVVLKNGLIYLGEDQTTGYSKSDVFELIRTYNDNGYDRLITMDLAESEEEHKLHLSLLREICSYAEMPVCAGGYFKRMEDVKDSIYAGASYVVLDDQSENCLRLIQDTTGRFGENRIILQLHNVDVLFKHREEVEQSVKLIVTSNDKIVESILNMTSIPVLPMITKYNQEQVKDFLLMENTAGICCEAYDLGDLDPYEIKTIMSNLGIEMSRFTAKLSWDDLKKNSDGMVPVIVQDYLNNDVLMLAYMNEEAFNHTIDTGKMTYWSRSRNELWVKGLTSGHFQYVKSLAADCDKDTILARVSQIGAACHTGSRSCFFEDIVHKDTVIKNPMRILEDTYDTIVDRKIHPKEGSISTYLFEKGIDKILVRMGKENTELMLAAKEADKEALSSEISDYLYYVMLLMVENDLTWKDVLAEMTNRE